MRISPGTTGTTIMLEPANSLSIAAPEPIGVTATLFLSSSTTRFKVRLFAPSTNAGAVNVGGGSNVTAPGGTNVGFPILPGEWQDFEYTGNFYGACDSGTDVLQYLSFNAT